MLSYKLSCLLPNVYSSILTIIEDEFIKIIICYSHYIYPPVEGS